VRAVLWLSVVSPSIFIAERLAGWTGAAAYAVVVAALLPVVLSLVARVSVPTARLLAVRDRDGDRCPRLNQLPTLDVDAPNRGSDDDDAHEVGVRALLNGENPYGQHTYLGNSISPMAGALLLAAPFALTDIIAAQNVVWLGVFFLVLARESGGVQTALGLCWTALLCLAVLHDLVTGTSHAANGIYVVVALAWLARARGSTASAIFLGVTLASRANFLFLLPCALGWLWRRESPVVALRAGAWAAGTAALLIVPSTSRIRWLRAALHFQQNSPIRHFHAGCERGHWVDDRARGGDRWRARDLAGVAIRRLCRGSSRSSRSGRSCCRSHPERPIWPRWRTPSSLCGSS
jgi:hypothetical protein